MVNSHDLREGAAYNYDGQFVVVDKINGHKAMARYLTGEKKGQVEEVLTTKLDYVAKIEQ